MQKYTFFQTCNRKKEKSLFSIFSVPPQQRPNPLPIESRDILPLDEFGTLGLAGVGVGAVAEAQFVHLGDHLLRSVSGLDLALWQQGQMTDFGANEQHGTSVLAGRHAGTAADARSRIHGHVSHVFRDGNGVGIGDATRGGADIASRLDDLVESGTVHHEVADDGEGLGAPWLDPDVVAILELAHVELAGGDAVVVAMGSAVDVESAHAANALAAVVVEAHGMCDAVVDKPLVQDVEHLKEGTIRRDVVDGVGLEMTLGTGIFLSPNM